MCICGCGSAKSYRKLADLQLGNTSFSFVEFAVAELSVNLRCPALGLGLCLWFRSVLRNRCAAAH